MNIKELIESIRIGCTLKNLGRKWELFDPDGTKIANVSCQVIQVLEACGAVTFEWRDFGAELLLK